jgi:hypothetical protein
MGPENAIRLAPRLALRAKLPAPQSFSVYGVPIWRLRRRCSASRRGKKYLQISVFRHNAGRAVTRWPAKAAGVRKPEAPRDDVRPSDLSPST